MSAVDKFYRIWFYLIIFGSPIGIGLMWLGTNHNVPLLEGVGAIIVWFSLFWGFAVAILVTLVLDLTGRL